MMLPVRLSSGSSKKGFTLIELMVVITVIAILATMVLFGLTNAQGAARDAARQQMMTGIQSALERYYGDNQRYPMAGVIVQGGGAMNYNNFFNGTMAVLGQGGYLDATLMKDPNTKYGLLFGAFGGADRYGSSGTFGYPGGFTGCSTPASWAHEETVSGTRQVAYSYYTPDGQSYVLCLKKESGGYSKFTSPN